MKRFTPSWAGCYSQLGCSHGFCSKPARPHTYCRRSPLVKYNMQYTVNNYRQKLCYFFLPVFALKSKAFALKSKAFALNYIVISKAFAYKSWFICKCFRSDYIFYMQMRVEKNNKAFAYRIYRHFTQQWKYPSKGFPLKM